MLDCCSIQGCEGLADIDGYDVVKHGPIYCDAHQPKCSVCGYWEFLGICRRCMERSTREGIPKVSSFHIVVAAVVLWVREKLGFG